MVETSIRDVYTFGETLLELVESRVYDPVVVDLVHNSVMHANGLRVLVAQPIVPLLAKLGVDDSCHITTVLALISIFHVVSDRYANA